MRKNLIGIGIVTILLLVFTGFFHIFHEQKNLNELVLYGNVDVRQVDIAFRVQGRVAELYFEEGDFVKEGTLLAILDKSPYDHQISQAKANVASVKATVENGAILLNRRRQAVEVGGVSKEDVDNALSSYNEQLANYHAAEASLAVALDNMSYTEVYAPTDGIILSRIREPGTVINPTDPIYTLSVSSPVWVRAFVDEPHLGEIYYGMAAEIYTDSGQIYDGQIGFISPMAEFTPKTVQTTQLRTDLVYRLRVYADNPDHYLKQGMPVTVKLSLKKRGRK